MNIKVSSHVFPNGFDITTPSETLEAKRSSEEELLIRNAHGTQIARIAREPRAGGVYDIIISGGGFYQFSRLKGQKRRWTCAGEGTTLQLSGETWSRFVLEEGSERIAECTKAWLTDEYTIAVLDEKQWKLVVCIFVALSRPCEDRGFVVPML